MILAVIRLLMQKSCGRRIPVRIAAALLFDRIT